MIEIYSGVAGNITILMKKKEKNDVIIRNHFIPSYYEELSAPGQRIRVIRCQFMEFLTKILIKIESIRNQEISLINEMIKFA